MFSETATELVRGNDFTMFWIAIALLLMAKLFVYFSNKCK